MSNNNSFEYYINYTIIIKINYKINKFSFNKLHEMCFDLSLDF